MATFVERFGNMQAPGRVLAVPVLALLIALACPVAASDKPARIVSLNLCTDQLILQMADRDRIASVTYLALDPAISHFADRARGLPVNHGLAEEVLPLKPDLVFAGAFTTRPTTALLQRLGYRVVVLETADSFDAVRRNIRKTGKALGDAREADRLVAAFDQALAGFTASGPRPSAIVLRPRGTATGRESLVDDILGAAGLSNLSARLGVTGIGWLTLERVIGARPDLIITDTDPRWPSLGHLTMRHPAYRAIRDGMGRPPRRANLPTHLWNCGGVHVIEAVAILSEARQALLGRRRGQ